MSDDKEKRRYRRAPIQTGYEIFQEDVDAADKYASEYRARVSSWVRDYLGYIPNEAVLMPYMATAQTLLKNMYEGTTSPIQGTEDFSNLAVCIRRDDMFKGDWVKCILNPYYQEIYDTELKEYKDKARERFCTFIQQDFPIEHSFFSELYLRKFLAQDFFYEGMPYCSADMKAVTIATYHQAYHCDGPEAADKLPLAGLMYGYYKPFGPLLEDIE